MPGSRYPIFHLSRYRPASVRGRSQLLSFDRIAAGLRGAPEVRRVMLGNIDYIPVPPLQGVYDRALLRCIAGERALPARQICKAGS